MLAKKLKTGKDEIVYLLSRVVEKYKQETGQELVLNTNRKNYEGLAILLSNISNQLPYKYNEWQTEAYSKAIGDEKLDYPYRKYDITGGQIKDAFSGIVSHPRNFLVDACYIYLYGIGRKGFENNPVDENLLDDGFSQNSPQSLPIGEQISLYKQQLAKLEKTKKSNQNKLISAIATIVVLSISLIGVYFNNQVNTQKLEQLKTDMSILPYVPTKAEIDSLEGIWLCYTGSPQARLSNADRYHKVVPNLLEVTYKDGYFVFNRYGASFNHVGYMQIESPGIVSIYSRIKNTSGIIESPRHSLMNLRTAKNNMIPVMSTSWNFDVGNNNRIVGIREVYRKIGKGGIIQEVMNDIENASCQCKIIRWMKPDKSVQVFYLKNERLENLEPKEIQSLINENSILLNEPDSTIILHDSFLSKY